jgi:hypothetical protein
MKNPETKTKLRAILKAAIWGGLIFATFTAFSIISGDFLGGPLFSFLDFYIFVPGDLFYQCFIGHMSTNPFDSSFLYDSYCVAVNSLIGVLIFTIVAIFRQFFKENNHEK